MITEIMVVIIITINQEKGNINIKDNHNKMT